MSDPAPTEAHADMQALITTMGRLATALEPLAEHVPALVEIALTWNAGKHAGKTIGKVGRFSETALKWAVSVAVSFSIISLAFHMKWQDILNRWHP